MTIALCIEPQDLLFCRDGRPIVAGEGAAAGSAMPSPQVVAGAIRSAVLKAKNQLPAHGGTPDTAAIAAVRAIAIRGPLLYAQQDIRIVRDGMPIHLPAGAYIPMPADLIGTKAKHGQFGEPTDRLVPQSPLAGWMAPADAPQAQALWPSRRDKRPSAPDGDPVQPGEQAPQNGFLTWEGFLAWQSGRVPRADQNHLRHIHQLWQTETRTQVALTTDEAVAAEGDLFTTRYLRLEQGLGLYVEIDDDAVGQMLCPQGNDHPSYRLHLGGDRRLARYRRIDPITWPTVQGPATALALTAPILPPNDGRCPGCWKPQCIGLAIPGADPISGWDLEHQHPKPVRWALKPGSVWHLADGCDHPPLIGCETDTGYGWVAYGSPPSAAI